jgi:hypothetical protein
VTVDLKSFDWAALRKDCAPISTADALFGFLSLHPTVRKLVFGISSGAIPEAAISEFVEGLFAAFRPGTRFDADIPLAAIATALSSRYTSFSRKFVKDLAEVKIREMPFAPRVARTSLSEPASKSGQTTAQKVILACRVGLDANAHVAPIVANVTTTRKTFNLEPA